jgi:ectoine hydroxylase-related dioxygenase (phytanoyl-CoA dioxygenase family)
VRQQENQQLGIPRSVAAGFPTRLRELVGYSVYNGLIGHVDKRDPIGLLDGAASTTGAGSDDHTMVWDVI